jgi:inhibitor of nuclear factor kappa-B kinase subunit alpha
MKVFREIIVKKFQQGMSRGDIFRSLKNDGVTRNMVYRTIKRFLDTGSNDDRPKMGRQRTVRTPAIVKVIRERIRRNCGRSARKTARELEINRETVRKIFKDDLKLKPFKKRKVHGVSEATKKKRIERSKHILAWHAGDEMIFSDEKMFVLEQSHNSQNDRAWSVSIQDIPEDKQHVPRFQNAASIMVWGAISPRGKLPLIFIEKGVKINANYYLEEVLKKNVMPNAKSLFGDDYYCFQQDGAPSHTANITQAWCKTNLTDFLAKDEWPPSSPDCNPLDYFVWSYMLSKLPDYKFSNLQQFKMVILKIWDAMSMEVVRAACNDFERRLKLVVKVKGGVIPKYLL